MIRFSFILSLSLCLGVAARAQDVNLDHEKIRQGRANPDSAFIDYLLELGSAYARDMVKTDSAEVLFAEGILLAEKIG
ncbi:MAG TPA: hypothetical protein VEW65_11170, partial [Chryseolinea sp.]|nr:hypothetical protein [Chryseolinea sp.]